MKHTSKQALLLLLAFLMCAQLLAVGVSAAPTAGVNGTVDVLRWDRVDSQDDLPDAVDCPVLLLYESRGSQYMLDAREYIETEWDNSKYSHWNYQFTPTALADGVRFGEKTFRTLENVGHMVFTYAGRRDSNNGNAKVYLFRSESEVGGSDYIAWHDEYCYTTPENIEYRYISVLTPGVVSDAEIRNGRVGMFANIGMRSDCLVRIDGSGKVYSVRSSSWDMGQFVMYVGHKETFSSIRSDYTIGSGSVANYNGYIYIEPGVTVTVETGGVMSVSGVIYNNGAVRSTGGDIVVQKGATIEQFCLDGKTGGTIECDGGDLVILSGGCVTTGNSANGALGCGEGGCVLRNGATCTNFGTLVTASSAYLLDGAAIDNRQSGTVLIGYSVTGRNSGNVNLLTTTAQKSTNTYIRTAQRNDGLYSAGMLFGGDDAIISNDGTIYLSTWAHGISDPDSIVGIGRGKIYVPAWAYAQRNSWDAPAEWLDMIVSM